MAANKPDFSLGRIDTPDVGGGLLDFADRQQKQYQIGLSNAVEADKLLRDRQRFAREQELNARQDTEYNREVSGRKALQDYASKPLDIGTMLGTQTKSADEAIVSDANRRNALWTKSLADNNVTQEDIDKGRVAPELLGKLYNPALDVNASAGIQKTYENITPFREDVESRVEKDLIAKNVDPLKAKQYAQMEGQKYQSIPEYQAMLTAQAEKMTNNSREQFKDNLELTKFNRETYKDELDKYKIKMDNLTHMMGSAGAGGTGGSGGGLLGGQDKSKIYEKVWTKSGNPEELSSKLDAAFQIYGARAVNNALTAAGIDEPVRLYSPDFGNRDVALDKFDAALKSEKPLSEIQSQFGNGAPNAPAYSLPTPATVYTADSARAAAQDRVKNSVLGYLGNSTSKSSSALLSEAANKDLPSSEIKKLVVDKYGDSNFNKSVYDKNLSEVESGGNYNAYNATSKAFGKYQFVPSTINSLIKQDGGKHTIDEVRKSPELQDYYYDKLTKENINTLKSNGVPVNNFTVYMAHNLGPSQTENFFSNEPLTDATKKAIQAQGVEPTREAYTNRFIHKFENTATPEEKRPTVQKEDISRMTDAERKAYADKLFQEYATEGPVKELSSKVNTDGVKNASKYTINEELLKRQGGVGGQDPDKKVAAQRTAEIDSILGPNPAPTPENLILMDEKLKLNPRTVVDKVSGYANTLRRELLDPLGPSGYAVGGIPKVGGTLSTGLSKLDDLLRPNKPLLLENLRPQGGANWTGTGRVATDKLNGISADTVLGQAGTQGNKLSGALRNADESKRLLDEVKPTNLSTPNYFSNMKNKANAVDKIKNETDARVFWNGVVDARSKGQLSDEQVMATMRKLNDSGLISTRELLEALDKIGFKR